MFSADSLQTCRHRVNVSFLVYCCTIIATIGTATAQTTAEYPSTSVGMQAPSAQTSGQSPVFGSVPDEKPTPGALSLTFKDAIDRALRHNLDALLSEYNT